MTAYQPKQRHEMFVAMAGAARYARLAAGRQPSR
jgi:hypothetical protein